MKIQGFQGEFWFLSNFASVKVELCGVTYPSVEHAYVAAKTLDLKLRAKVARLSKPGDVKRFGRTFPLRHDWERIKVDVMTDLLIQKFAQEPFRTNLLNTGDADIEETNWWGDRFWGVCDGEGLNTLGELLMWVRDQLEGQV
jgi:ribA/ribD-fused uncharacterized protein